MISDRSVSGWKKLVDIELETAENDDVRAQFETPNRTGVEWSGDYVHQAMIKWKCNI
ncbi:AAEL012173-PA [Aedes aegypti]|uniref:AAEL012173-PA n=1 Tax=Aedes aegypti TaxID=7159 RepID=Q16MW2_AEDAE|nr:AAEL012173-PA [Aedes aegypti]